MVPGECHCLERPRPGASRSCAPQWPSRPLVTRRALSILGRPSRPPSGFRGAHPCAPWTRSKKFFSLGDVALRSAIWPALGIRQETPDRTCQGANLFNLHEHDTPQRIPKAQSKAVSPVQPGGSVSLLLHSLRFRNSPILGQPSRLPSGFRGAHPTPRYTFLR